MKGLEITEKLFGTETRKGVWFWWKCHKLLLYYITCVHIVTSVIPHQEQYVNVSQNLYGYHGDQTEIAMGSYEFPFNFTLPQNIPSSFDIGQRGRVRYYVKVKIERPWKFDHTSVCFFTVVTPVDLNMNPQAQVQMRVLVVLEID